MSDPAGLWVAAMLRAAIALRDGDQETAVAKLAHASWLAALSDYDISKDEADRAKRAVFDAANKGAGAA